MTDLGTAQATAGAARTHRDALVEAIATGALDIRELGPDAGPVKVVVLAQAVPGVGKVRSRRLMETLSVGPHARWGDLDGAAAAELAGALVALAAESPATAGDASPAAGT